MYINGLLFHKPGTNFMIVESRKVSPKTTDPKVHPGCSMLGISYKYKQTYKNQGVTS